MFLSIRNKTNPCVTAWGSASLQTLERVPFQWKDWKMLWYDADDSWVVWPVNLQETLWFFAGVGQVSCDAAFPVWLSFARWCFNRLTALTSSDLKLNECPLSVSCWALLPALVYWTVSLLMHVSVVRYIKIAEFISSVSCFVVIWIKLISSDNSVHASVMLSFTKCVCLFVRVCDLCWR